MCRTAEALDAPARFDLDELADGKGSEHDGEMRIDGLAEQSDVDDLQTAVQAVVESG